MNPKGLSSDIPLSYQPKCNLLQSSSASPDRRSRALGIGGALKGRYHTFSHQSKSDRFGTLDILKIERTSQEQLNA
ncbi:hypothetical protein [Scytonema sp. PCC 10023]|uniref:hypothetical protein n=1 Tax=Scytonema sp. PCC 10023 TaxID=1680591 RepID=UPI0039C5C3D7